jgi:signal transduction histidine kinase
MELDQLLGQLVNRAQEVMGTQGRLRGLLRANRLIIGELDLPSVLQHVVEAARELVGAHYAALGIIAPGGGLSEFVHVGMPEEVVGRIGELPQGKGLLGALIDDPTSIRLQRIADDSRSSGFPPGHPPMDSFLGVPIEIRGTVFGNLYLSESDKGQFSQDDEELTRALAATAAAAIDNARLYEFANGRSEWLRASAAITAQLLSADDQDGTALRLIAIRSRELAHADLVVVVLPVPTDDALGIEVAVGDDAGSLTGRILPLDGSLSGRVYREGKPLRLNEPQEAGVDTMASGTIDVGPCMLLPLQGSAGMLGVLGAFRYRGRPGFAAEELEMAGSFAAQAAVAIELADARAEQQRAAMLDDRERIAADLHDHVIQKLFAAGLSLQTVSARVGPGKAQDRITTIVDDLDDTISQIRTTIFALQQTHRSDASSTRARLLDVVVQARHVLGFAPAMRFSGLLDTIRGAVVDDVVAVLREALSNVARHAGARSADVAVTVAEGWLILEVCDDGVGFSDSDSGRSSGLSNLRQRANDVDRALRVMQQLKSGRTEHRAGDDAAAAAAHDDQLRVRRGLHQRRRCALVGQHDFDPNVGKLGAPGCQLLLQPGLLLRVGLCRVELSRPAAGQPQRHHRQEGTNHEQIATARPRGLERRLYHQGCRRRVVDAHRDRFPGRVRAATYDDDGALGVGRHRLAHRAQQQAAEPATTAAAEHHQLGVLRLLDQPGGGMSHQRITLDDQLRVHHVRLVDTVPRDALGVLPDEIRIVVAVVVAGLTPLPVDDVADSQRQLATARFPCCPPHRGPAVVGAGGTNDDRTGPHDPLPPRSPSSLRHSPRGAAEQQVTLLRADGPRAAVPHLDGRRRASQRGKTSGSFGLAAPLACVELGSDQLLVGIEPGPPLVPPLRLRFAASFAPADLVASLVGDVTELTPGVAGFLSELPAGVTDSGDLTSASGEGPLAAMSSYRTHGLSQDVHVSSLPDRLRVRRVGPPHSCPT